MDDAPLDLRLREHSLDGIPEARQAVHRKTGHPVRPGSSGHSAFPART